MSSKNKLPDPSRVVRALNEAQFRPGADAILIYRSKKHCVKVVVRIIGVVLDIPDIGDVTIQAYRVSSNRGGRLTVPPACLRPGTVLDRINIALDED